MALPSRCHQSHHHPLTTRAHSSTWRRNAASRCQWRRSRCRHLPGETSRRRHQSHVQSGQQTVRRHRWDHAHIECPLHSLCGSWRRRAMTSRSVTSRDVTSSHVRAEYRWWRRVSGTFAPCPWCSAGSQWTHWPLTLTATDQAGSCCCSTVRINAAPSARDVVEAAMTNVPRVDTAKLSNRAAHWHHSASRQLPPQPTHTAACVVTHISDGRTR